jgi:hypothetical protein
MIFLSVYILNQNFEEVRGKKRLRNTVVRYQRYPLLVICQIAWNNPSREANSHSASKKNPPPPLEPECPLPCSREPDSDPYPESVESSPRHHPGKEYGLDSTGYG